MSEENTLAILNTVDPYHTLSPTLSTHFAESNLRLLEAVYSKIRERYREDEPQSPPLTIFPLSSALKNIKNNRGKISAEFDIASCTKSKAFIFRLSRIRPPMGLIH